MPESGPTRLWDRIMPPPPPGHPQAVPRRKLQPKQKRLIYAATAFIVLAGASLAAYSYVSGAPDRAETAYKDGMRSMQPGKYPAAITELTRSIQIYPLPKAYMERGNAHRFLGEMDPAIADFEKAVDLDPSLAPAYTSLGSIYRDRGDRQRALDEYSKSIAIARNVDALYERGEMYEAAGEHQKAIDDFTSAIDGMRDAPYMYRARALARRNLGDTAGYEADRDYARAIEHPH
jgi:tetratricopeptide (TPR) repeat protein